LAAIVVAGCNFAPLFVTGGDFVETGRTLSHFTAIQVDPRSEDSAGPQFVAASDVNEDGLMDLVSAWNQTQPVQIHLQRRDTAGAISFETITLAGNIPVVSVAGLAVADFDNDGREDIAALIKESLLDGAGCLSGASAESGSAGVVIIYFAPQDPSEANRALAWEEVRIGNSLLLGSGETCCRPEEGGYTAMAVGDMDCDGDLDIVAALNGACGNGILLFTNLSPELAHPSSMETGRYDIGTWNREVIPDAFPGSSLDSGNYKDVALADVDHDGDLDIVLTRPAARSMNIRWLRNPLCPPLGGEPAPFDVADDQWHVGTVGQIDCAGGADILRLGDIDRDGIVDVVMRSTTGGLIQWLKGPATPTTDPYRNIPWQVFTLAEFRDRTPEALALGDVNFDGQLDLITSAEGALLMFDAQNASSVFDQWPELLIIDDDPSDQSDDGATTADPNVEQEEVASTTAINSIVVADIDGDGANDLVATFDRSGLSGLSNDVLVWFRNTQRP
jgi:hypothetical protein